MHSSIFFGGSVVAAVMAGAVALFAPCCISAMLPAYFASAFHNRRLLVAMTFLFAAGVATVILPIALGAAVIQRVLIGNHTEVYLGAGGVLLALGTYVVLGGKVSLPMPGRRAGRTGPLAVYSLGAFSGAASACCAPVLAGVIALSGLASSFALSLVLGLSYVFGMVAPLFVISLLWERFEWSSSRLCRPRTVRWHLGPLQRSVSAGALASGVLLVLMGIGAIAYGIAGMPSPSGWQSEISSRLQHWGKQLTDALGFVPSWVAAALVLAAVALLARKAFAELVGPPPAPSVPEPDPEATPEAEYV
jgi:cytochrome c-type biogenesis protein